MCLVFGDVNNFAFISFSLPVAASNDPCSLSVQIYELMKTDCYQRFLKSDIYKECVLAEAEGKALPYQNNIPDEMKCFKKNGSNSSGVGGSVVDSKKEAKRKLDVAKPKRKSLLPWNLFLSSTQCLPDLPLESPYTISQPQSLPHNNNNNDNKTTATTIATKQQSTKNEKASSTAAAPPIPPRPSRPRSPPKPAPRTSLMNKQKQEQQRVQIKSVDHDAKKSSPADSHKQSVNGTTGIYKNEPIRLNTSNLSPLLRRTVSSNALTDIDLDAIIKANHNLTHLSTSSCSNSNCSSLSRGNEHANNRINSNGHGSSQHSKSKHDYCLCSTCTYENCNIEISTNQFSVMIQHTPVIKKAPLRSINNTANQDANKTTSKTAKNKAAISKPVASDSHRKNPVFPFPFDHVPRPPPLPPKATKLVPPQRPVKQSNRSQVANRRHLSPINDNRNNIDLFNISNFEDSLLDVTLDSSMAYYV